MQLTSVAYLAPERPLAAMNPQLNRGSQHSCRATLQTSSDSTCLVKLDDSLDANEHKVHLNGFSPECVRLWIVKLPATAKVFKQPGKSQAYGRAPVCVLMCCACSTRW
jgi:hypothetical protein